MTTPRGLEPAFALAYGDVHSCSSDLLPAVFAAPQRFYTAKPEFKSFWPNHACITRNSRKIMLVISFFLNLDTWFMVCVVPLAAWDDFPPTIRASG